MQKKLDFENTNIESDISFFVFPQKVHGFFVKNAASDPVGFAFEGGAASCLDDDAVAAFFLGGGFVSMVLRGGRRGTTRDGGQSPDDNAAAGFVTRFCKTCVSTLRRTPFNTRE